MIPVVITVSVFEDDLPDHWINMGGVFTAVASTATIESKILMHNTELSEGDVKSIHMDDDTTAYQNTTGNAAFATLRITATGSGSSTRHIRIYSAPTSDSTSSATLLFEFGTGDTNAFDSSGNTMTVSGLKIQNNHYLVLENVDDSRAGTNDVFVVADLTSSVQEFSNI